MSERSATRREFLGAAGVGGAAVNLGNVSPRNATDVLPDHPFAPAADQRWTTDMGGDPILVPTTGDGLYAVTGNAVVRLGLDGTPRWRFGVEVADDQYPGVLVRGDTVYVEDDQMRWLLDADGGAVRWGFHREKYANVLAATPETAFVGGEELVALSPTDGSELWRFDPEYGSPWGNPLVRGDVVYLGTTDGGFYALDADDGAVRWQVRLPDEDGAESDGYPHLVPAGVTDERVLVWASGRGTLYGLSREPVRRLWMHRSDSESYDFPGEVRDDVAYFTHDSSLRVVSVADGRVAWDYDFGREVGGGPTVYGDAVYAGGMGGVAALRRDGTERWRFTTGDETHAAVVGTLGDLLVVDSHETAVYAVSRTDGRLRWQFDYPEPATWRPRVVGDIVCVATESGTVYALSPPESTPLYDAYRAATSPASIALGGLLATVLFAGAYRRRRGGTETTGESRESAAFSDFELRGTVVETDHTEVREARTPDGERVALKQVEPDAIDADDFTAAVQTWADLDCRGVLGVREWDTDPAPWVATDPVDATLADRAADLSADDLAHAVADAAEAVHRANREGVTHGGLGAESVWFADGEVRVADWGLAAGLRGTSDRSDLASLAAMADDLLGDAGVADERLPDDPAEYDSPLEFADALRWAVR